VSWNEAALSETRKLQHAGVTTAPAVTNPSATPEAVTVSEPKQRGPLGKRLPALCLLTWDFGNGIWYCEVVQLAKGLWLHSADRRRQRPCSYISRL